jgi:Photosynthetic reaction centre cytochrome C subunit
MRMLRRPVSYSISCALISVAAWASVSAMTQRLSLAAGHDVDRSFNVALGVECTHCHVGEAWRDQSRPAFAVAKRMIAMREFLERDGLADTSGVTCWSCHRGQRRPPRVPFEAWESIMKRRFTGSLASVPEDVQLTMAVYSASLGVECTHCHVDGQWTATGLPAHATARRMNEMITKLPQFLPAGARTQCFMCHQGKVRPALRP